MDRIHIACGANTAYMPLVSAMLHSLLSQPRDRAMRVHFLYDDGLDAGQRELLAAMVCELGGEWQAHCIAADQLQMFPPNARFGREAWYRILLPELLPTVDKVLYLDADTIVRRSIVPLWNTDLSAHTLGAVFNPFYGFMSIHFQRGLGIDDPRDYFNSGVLLINLRRWRERDVGASMRRFVIEHGETQSFPDQNALNCVLRGEWLKLDPIWNAQSVYYDLPTRKLPISAAQLAELRSNPAIVHFVGPYKAWDYLCKQPFLSDYFKHSSKTPWAGHPIRGKTLPNRVLRLSPQPWTWMWVKVYLPRLVQRFKRAARRLRGLS